MLEQIYTDLLKLVDKNIITTAHYKDMGSWMAEVMNKLKITFKKNIYEYSLCKFKFTMAKMRKNFN